MTGPAQRYASISREIERIVRANSNNDREQAASMVMRAGALIIRSEKGARIAAEKAYALGDELGGEGVEA